jgi:hypothetical protein
VWYILLFAVVFCVVVDGDFVGLWGGFGWGRVGVEVVVDLVGFFLFESEGEGGEEMANKVGVGHGCYRGGAVRAVR